MLSRYKKSSGFYLETLVANKLKEAGFSIISRNRKICGVEIDIIARKTIETEEHYYFVECKFRRHIDSFLLMSQKQKERYRKAAALWQSEMGCYMNIHMALATQTPDTTIQIFLDYF